MEVTEIRRLKDEAEKEIEGILMRLEKKCPGMYINHIKYSRSGPVKLIRYARGEYINIEIEMGF